MTKKKIRLLLIEDDVVDQISFKRLVKAKSLPYDLEIAGSVAEARKILTMSTFDIVVTDYYLGDGTAFDVFDYIIDTPFIFTTGGGDEQVAVEAMKAGAFYYHIKDSERSYLELLPVSIDKALKEKQMLEIQRKAEQDLKDSELKFRAISSAANDAIIVMNYDGDVLFWNRAAEKIFGYKVSEILGKNLDKMIVPEESNAHYLKGLKYHWQKGIETALGERVEIKVLKRDRSVRLVEMSLSAVKLKGDLTSIVVIRDITEQKEAAIQLKHNKERLDIILQNIGNGVLAINSEQKVLLANPNTYKLLGFSKFNNVIDDLPALLTNCESNGKTLINSLSKKSFRNLELIVVKPVHRILHITETSFEDIDGQSAGKIFILADVTSEKEIDRMKTDFVSNVTHELRTPITSIKGFTKTMLMNDKLSSSKTKEFLEIIFKESNRLAELIEDLLSISKIESGESTYNLEEVSVGPIIEHVYNIFKMQAAKKDIILTCEIKEDLPKIIADHDAIHQIAVNLIGNALKFTPYGGEIGIKIDSTDDEVLMQVNDNGLGIPIKDQDKIFDKFFRVRRPGTEIPGTGLGLSIVKEIADRHRGRIEYGSEENNGSSFKIFFPILNN